MSRGAKTFQDDAYKMQRNVCNATHTTDAIKPDPALLASAASRPLSSCRDAIKPDPALLASAAAAPAVIFGSLAQRDPVSR
eukprot:4800058-Pyramimonas_sp.AAC.1